MFRALLCPSTGYGLDSPGIESRWGGEIFRSCPDRPWGPPSLLYNGYRVFPGGKERPRRDADPSPSSAVVKKEYSYTSTPPMGRTACTEPQCLYKGALYLYLYRYSPHGPYGLTRASLPLQGCTLPLLHPSSGAHDYNVYYHIGRLVLGLL